jgi:aspartyl protease family protein
MARHEQMQRVNEARQAGSMNNELPHMAKVITVWLVVGLVVFVGIEWWQQRALRTSFQAGGDRVEIRRGLDGHYHWPGSINGREVDFLVDTGATGTAISAALANELGLASLASVKSRTAGGMVSGELVSADVVLRGGVSAQRLQVVALPGLGDRPLLGMDILGRLHWQQRDGLLIVDLKPGL